MSLKNFYFQNLENPAQILIHEQILIFSSHILTQIFDQNLTLTEYQAFHALKTPSKIHNRLPMSHLNISKHKKGVVPDGLTNKSFWIISVVLSKIEYEIECWWIYLSSPHRKGFLDKCYQIFHFCQSSASNFENNFGGLDL